MTDQEETREKKRRRDLLLILLLLPLGILCIFFTGGAAIRLAPTWVLPADMGSNLDPDSDFFALGTPVILGPLDSNILTQPVWESLFLTPDAVIPTREIIVIPTPPPPARTPEPPPVFNTPDIEPPATATLIGPIIPPTSQVRPEANLAVTKTDGSDTYTPGEAINYTIVVINYGPDWASRFSIVDNIPSVITGLTVSCTPSARCGTDTSSGNAISFTGADLDLGDQLSVTVSGLVASGATGNLDNTAEVIIPVGAGYRDTVTDNNTATDTDTQLSIYDVAITKSDGIDTYVATTTQFDYTLVVTNSGPSDAFETSILDDIPAQITTWDWVCISEIDASGCTGVTGSTTDFTDDLINIQSGGRIEYAVTAYLVPGVIENISNTASIAIPGGLGVIVDPDLTNNSATDTNAPYIDLQISKDDGVATYTPGGTVTYSVIVTNLSTFDLTGLTVTDNMPTLVTSWSWTCLPDPGASCTAAGASDINDLVDLPAGASITYTIIADVHPSAAGDLENTAIVSPPAGLVDVTPADNTVTDTNVNVVGEPEVGPPDGSTFDIPDGGSAAFYLSEPIIANGDPAADFVFYESPFAPGIVLDHIVIEISTTGLPGSWFPVFFWGDATADTNTNVDNVNIPNIASACPTEVDNCSIDGGDLYNGTGITIDVDNSPLSPGLPPGTYSWIQFSEPGLGSTDGTHVDAIEILP
jgi:uncharacterized repeat protein (TIGR01451 family)